MVGSPRAGLRSGEINYGLTRSAASLRCGRGFQEMGAWRVASCALCAAIGGSLQSFGLKDRQVARAIVGDGFWGLARC